MTVILLTSLLKQCIEIKSAVFSVLSLRYSLMRSNIKANDYTSEMDQFCNAIGNPPHEEYCLCSQSSRIAKHVTNRSIAEGPCRDIQLTI